jgi:hypothetical protein
MSLKTVEISRAKFHEIQKTNNAHDVTMTSNTYRFCWKQDNDSLHIGPYMALIVPSSFYRIDAGLHALSFSLDFNERKLYLK